VHEQQQVMTGEVTLSTNFCNFLRKTFLNPHLGLYVNEECALQKFGLTKQAIQFLSQQEKENKCHEVYEVSSVTFLHCVK
jgi:hypothetical protein